VVFLFAKTADDALAGLVKKIDALVVAQEEKKLAAVVNIVGPATDEAKAAIKAFGEKAGLKKVPLTLTTDAAKFKVSGDAEVTVMLYRGKKVQFNLAVAKGGLDEKTVAAILEATKKMLAEPAEAPKPKQKAKKPKE